MPAFIPALMWGGRIALSAGARYLPGIAARVGTGLRGALGFAARRPITTAVGAHIATDGASTDMLMPGMPNIGEMASSAGNWLTGTTMGNLTMGAGGLFLANQLFGGGGGGLGGMLNNVAGIGAGVAAIAPLFMAENGFPRAMGAFQQIFQGIANGAHNGDWSGVSAGFSELGQIYGEGFGQIGNRLGINGETGPAAAAAGAVPSIGADAAGDGIVPPAGEVALPAAGDDLHARGEATLAAADAADATPARIDPADYHANPQP